MNAETPEAFYRKRKEELEKELSVIHEKRKRIAWQRFLVVLLTGFAVYQSWNYVSALLIFIEIVVGFSFFLFIVSKDTNAKNKVANLDSLVAVIEKEIKVLNYDYKDLETGEEYLPPNHAYANDLDIFGESSLFQYINRCTTGQGKELLANRLLYPIPKQQAEEEQETMQELAEKPAFIHQLLAYGAANHITKNTEKKIKQWLDLPIIYTQKRWQWLANAFPFFSLGVIALYAIDIISSVSFYALLFAFYLVASYISRNIGKTYDVLYNTSAEIITLQKQLEWIEAQNFTSQKMMRLKQNLSGANTTVSKEIKDLYSILNRFDIRLNHFAFFFLNTLFLWDLHQLLSLNKWKEKNKNGMSVWFVIIAETEYSGSLSTLLFNKPTWIIPSVTGDFFHINTSNISHPLLREEISVANSFSLNGQGKVAIITGSNMGGKSTFLRSLGVNTVLALMGAPVCAESFSVSCIHVMSSMRVADNLSESTSTFYAELKKLKTIIEAVNNKEQIFILLDEILRGTNSLDRHVGSVALLKQLIQHNAVAVIATHDVELAKLKTEYPQAVQNYHFDVQAKGAELYFDYKLKDGICKSMNASILMKSIGIEMD